MKLEKPVNPNYCATVVRIREIASEHNAEVEVKFFDVPLDECIKRDAKRENPVGEKVIRDMYYKYVYKPPVARTYDPKLMDVAVVDIDGTLALMHDRGPFDWGHVWSDLPNKPIVNLARKLSAHVCPLIIVSGRDSVCRKDTEEWLEKQGIVYLNLFMRPEEDMRKDAIVKREIFDQNIDKRYNVLWVLDDRDQVVSMWRELGLTCLQVAEGKF